MEIESRLLPCGLHVVGSPPTAMEAIATLVNIAEIDRPENDPPVKGLPGILARSINRNMEEIYLNNNRVRTANLTMHNMPYVTSTTLAGAQFDAVMVFEHALHFIYIYIYACSLPCLPTAKCGVSDM